MESEALTMLPNKVVFLFDLDNTLLDNDHESRPCSLARTITLWTGKK